MLAFILHSTVITRLLYAVKTKLERVKSRKPIRLLADYIFNEISIILFIFS